MKKKQYIAIAVIFFVLAAALAGYAVYLIVSHGKVAEESAGPRFAMQAIPFLVYSGVLLLCAVITLVVGKKKLKQELEEKQKAEEEAKANAEAGNAQPSDAVVPEEAPAEDASEEEKVRGPYSSPVERPKKVGLPGEGWFKKNGLPLKDIPISKADLRALDDDEKTAISLTTFAYLKKRLFIALAAIIAAAVVILVLFLKNLIAGAIGVLVVLFGGGFVLGKIGRLIDGFMFLKGPQRIGVGILWQLLILPLQFILTIMGVFSSLIYLAVDSIRKEKAASLPRVALPSGCGYDDILDYYTEYEKEVRELDEMKLNAKQEEYRKKQQGLDDLKHAVDTSDLGMQDKAQLDAEIGKVKDKNKENYEKAFGPDDKN